MLVDRHDYHTFQPLLYQLATGLLEQTAVGHSLRDLLEEQENTSIHKATVTAVDLDARKVTFEEIGPLSYDYLVLGLGAEVNFFGTEGAAEHAFPMYTLPNAVHLKDHLLERWEAAERDPSLVEDGALNVVIVGGGPTGVETAGAIAELYRADFAKDYPSLPQDEARVILVEAGPELFSMLRFHASSSRIHNGMTTRKPTRFQGVGRRKRSRNARTISMPWVKRTYPWLYPRYAELYGSRAYAPKAYQQEVSERFARLRLRHGIGGGSGLPRREVPQRQEQLALAV